MPAPKRPNTAAATAAVVRRGQETMAAKLRAAGWTVIPPADTGSAPPDAPLAQPGPAGAAAGPHRHPGGEQGGVDESV